VRLPLLGTAGPGKVAAPAGPAPRLAENAGPDAAGHGLQSL